MHNWGAGKALLMSGLSDLLQLLDLACHTHLNQSCKNYRLHWFLVFIWEGRRVCTHVRVQDVHICACEFQTYVRCMYTQFWIHCHAWIYWAVCNGCCRAKLAIHIRSQKESRRESWRHIWSSKFACQLCWLLSGAMTGKTAKNYIHRKIPQSFLLYDYQN